MAGASKFIQRFSRRAWWSGAAVSTLGLALPSAARSAGPETLEVAVGNAAVASLVTVVGGPHVRVRFEESLSAEEIHIGEQSFGITNRVLLKGSAAARTRFLDDGRNATLVADNVRAALSKIDPDRARAFTQAYQAWARAFARDVFGWTRRLKSSPLADRTIRDVYGRIYLLEWAGAKVDPSARDPGPKTLANAPARPSAFDLAAYRAYVGALVEAVTKAP